jgi:hypothetical protein
MRPPIYESDLREKRKAHEFDLTDIEKRARDFAQVSAPWTHGPVWQQWLVCGGQDAEAMRHLQQPERRTLVYTGPCSGGCASAQLSSRPHRAHRFPSTALSGRQRCWRSNRRSPPQQRRARRLVALQRRRRRRGRRRSCRLTGLLLTTLRARCVHWPGCNSSRRGWMAFGEKSLSARQHRRRSCAADCLWATWPRSALHASAHQTYCSSVPLHCTTAVLLEQGHARHHLVLGG